MCLPKTLFAHSSMEILSPSIPNMLSPALARNASESRTLMHKTLHAVRASRSHVIVILTSTSNSQIGTTKLHLATFNPPVAEERYRYELLAHDSDQGVVILTLQY
jgi:hypothetical protein